MLTTRNRAVAVCAAAVLALPSLTACNLTTPSTCDAFTLTTSAGGKSGGKSGGGSKGGTSKTKPKTGTGTKTKTGGGSDHDCD